MRDGKEASTTQDRVTPEELNAIRRLLADPDGHLPDLRDHGAVTLGDVAESLDVPESEVRRQLDRVREEKAFLSSPSRRSGQVGLLALALVLFGSAYTIFRLNHKLTSEEIDAQVDEMLAKQRERRLRNPVVHYPIEKIVVTGPLPPPGFEIGLRGMLADTKAENRQKLPIEAEAAQTALAAALTNAFEQARQAEADAPSPKKPLPPDSEHKWGFDVRSDAMILSFGRQPRMYVATTPPSVTDIRFPRPAPPYLNGHNLVDPTPEAFAAIARGEIKSIVEYQNRSLQDDTPGSGNYVSSPAGYGIRVKGRSERSDAPMPLRVLPIDEAAVARKLEKTVRTLVRQDIEGRDFPTFGASGAFKRPIPPVIEVTIEGPLRSVLIQLPQEASRKYPTAADALRASDRILAEGVRKAAAQVGELDRGVTRRER